MSAVKCHKHRFRLMYVRRSVLCPDNRWWEFRCVWCGGMTTVHPSKFWNMYPEDIITL